jgi:hypothetical protein
VIKFVVKRETTLLFSLVTKLIKQELVHHARRGYASAPTLQQLNKQRAQKLQEEELKKKLLAKQREREERRIREEKERLQARKERDQIRADKDKLRKFQQILAEKQKRRQELAKLREVKRHAKEVARLRAQKKKELAAQRLKGKRAEKPKRPLNALLWYSTQNFKRVHASLKTGDAKVKLPEVQKKLSEEFNNLSQTEKDYYLKLAADDLARYQTEMKAYVQRKNKNKRPLTPYMRFFNSIRDNLMKDHPGLKTTEYAKLAGQRWRELDTNQKQVFQDEYAREVEQRNNSDQ